MVGIASVRVGLVTELHLFIFSARRFSFAVLLKVIPLFLIVFLCTDVLVADRFELLFIIYVVGRYIVFFFTTFPVPVRAVSFC